MNAPLFNFFFFAFSAWFFTVKAVDFISNYINSRVRCFVLLRVFVVVGWYGGDGDGGAGLWCFGEGVRGATLQDEVGKRLSRDLPCVSMKGVPRGLFPLGGVDDDDDDDEDGVCVCVILVDLM